MHRVSTQELRIGILVAIVAVILFRVPELIYPGRFWAEEATVYFQEAYTGSPWAVLLKPNLGYYSLVNKVGSLLAARVVPLALAPLVTSVIALLIQILPFVLILWCEIDALPSLWSRSCACLLVLLVQPNQEVWLNSINSQFFLCVASGIILVSEPPGRRWHLMRLAVLSLAGLTGVVSCLLLPVFAVSYAHSRSRRRLHETAVLMTACAIQGMFILAHPARENPYYLNLLPFALLSKQWILPFLGESVAQSFFAAIRQKALSDGSVYSLAAALPHVVVGVALALWGKRDVLLLFAASVGLASMSFLKSVEAENPAWLVWHISPYGAGRYYYAPNVFLALALLMVAWSPPLHRGGLRVGFRALCCCLVAMLVWVGAADYVRSERHTWVFSGPDWPREVRNWNAGRSNVLGIWPRGWQLKLPRNEAPSPDQREARDGPPPRAIRDPESR